VKDACDYNADFLWAPQWNIGCNFDDVPDTPEIPEDLNNPDDIDPEDSSVDTSTVPSRMDPVTVEDAGFNIRVSWLPPSTDGGKEVTEYRIQFKSNLGTFHELSQCDGSSSSSMSNNYCEV